ncbi:BrnT family toxin [Pusillimonas sp.]|uniref:BrnT family toxin n=1 Tax=Pusillimonas sp. TaxID=3040095 RepID=UPI0037C6BD0A
MLKSKRRHSPPFQRDFIEAVTASTIATQIVSTIKMLITFDPAKSARNELLRGLPFSIVENFDFETARIVLDQRKNYGEIRYFALGRISGRVHALVFTETASGIRVISLRKANFREILRYEQTTRKT